MNVLITGGTGFIGCRLALQLLAAGETVRVLGQANNEYETENKRLLEAHGADVVLASVTERERIFEVTHGIDLVYHFAAAQHEANVPDQLFHDVNVTGTKNLLDASVAAGVGRFVHGSTIGVYGSAMDGVIDEQTPVRPDNIYGITKLEGEKLVLTYADQLPVTVIRISEVYGPGDQRLLKLFRGIEKGIFFKIGDGENLHHLIYIDDLLEGLRLAATNDEALGEVFVLSGKEPLTTDDMIDIIANELGATLPPVRAPLPLFMGAAVAMETTMRPLGLQPPLHRRRMDFFKKSFAFDGQKAADRLGFHPSVSFEQGVAETARWYGEQGYLARNGSHPSHAQEKHRVWSEQQLRPAETATDTQLTARIEQFDSFWEGPEDVEKGYASFGKFYRANYMPYVPKDRTARILVISCGPGYFVNVLQEEGYRNVIGIDSDYEKVKHAARRNLNCLAANAVDFLDGACEPFDVIFCEQELNHLTKDEMVMFLRLCWRTLRPGGTLIVHGLNGANPLTGSDASAQNFDHFNTFTEYSLQQVLEYCGFERVRILPLNLYVFYDNPLNYVGLAIMATLSILFRIGFMLYGKKNKNFTKKIGGVGIRSQS